MDKSPDITEAPSLSTAKVQKRLEAISIRQNPKDKAKKPDPPITTPSSATTVTPSQSEGTEEIVKKKRGRPRKNPVTPPVVPVPVPVIATNEDDQIQKPKTRGRHLKVNLFRVTTDQPKEDSPEDALNTENSGGPEDDEPISSSVVKDEPTNEVEPIVDSDKSADFSGIANVSSIFNVKIEPTFGPGYIPGLDLINDSMEVESSTNPRELDFNIIKKSSLTSKEKKSVETSEADDKQNQEDDSDNKIRRSSRIKTLEEQRGSRGRRREVVFSTNDGPGSNKSSLPTNDDDSNSNGSNSLHGSFSTLSSPLREANNFSTTSSMNAMLPSIHNFSAVTSGLFTSSSGSLKPLKVKSRWRYSLDAENMKYDSSNGNSADSHMTSSGTGVFDSNNPTAATLGSHHIQNTFEMSLKDRNLVRKSGHIVYEASDVELEDKLKKFEGIDENLFRTDKKISKEGRGMVCDCFLSKEDIMRGEIGCNEDCLNRLLMVECGSRCPTGDRCTNKKFQRKEYCPLEVFQTDKKGHGLRTLQPLPQGGFVIEYVGEVLDAREFKHRTKEYAKGKQEHFYFMALKSDAIIDATLRGNCSRFINHSCEPNCETQKWTVNGELRIGFFSIRDLQAGEEITFDYQFQRYGKKAQRCYCMTASCRGWIGGDEEGEKESVEPSEVQADVEQEQDQEKVKEKPKAERKKRKEVQLEDMAFEEELGKLELSGLKNRHHTLTLSRLMVRAEDWDIKERLLKILVNGDTPCRRLFLDYHGLRLIWSWMVDLPLPAQGSEIQLIRNDQYHMLFLKALASLPIPNKSLLQDSKVLTLMEKWANSPPSSIISSVPKTESSEAVSKDGKNVTIKVEDSSSESKSSDSVTKSQDVKVSPESTCAEETPIKSVDADTMEAAVIKAAQEELNWEFVSVAKSLLESWADLKEVFRIPKKERVEQMKEHEREADKGSGHNDGSVSSGYERDSRKYSRSKERRVHVIDSSQHMPAYHRPSRDRALSHPNLSKEERRLIFAAKVARQEMENKRRREQDDMVNLHQERCAALGLDAATTPIVDPSGSYYLDPNTISWIEIKVDDPNLPPELIPLVQATLYPPPVFEMLTPEPEFVFPPWPDGLPPPPPLPPATLPPRWKMAVDDEGRCYYYDIKTRHTQWYPPSPESSEGYVSQSSGSSDSEDAEEEEVIDDTANVVAQIHFQTKRSKLNERAEKRKKAGLVQERVISPRLEDERPAVSQKSIRARKQQLLEEKLKKLQEAEGIALVRAADGDLTTESGSPERVVAIKEKHSRSHGVPTKRRRKESNSRHSQQSKSKSISKLRTKSHVSESQNLELSQMLVPESEFETPETANKPDNQDSGNPTVDSIIDIPTDTPATDIIPGFMTDEERAAMAADSPRPTASVKKSERPKISEKDRKKHHGSHKKERDKDGSSTEKRSKEASKESFRNQIANVIVTHLNPYRKPDCKHGRIASTDDFKHLARKMTHAILLKELKHTRDAKSLEVNDSVRHKTKEYVKKFMARFPNSNYAKSPEDTQGKS